ncbi:MAG TPA: glycosyltransferase [Acidimicrobiia bacterium]|nr:glycosyltransferase [Acidimicrobiia bacterium]
MHRLLRVIPDPLKRAVRHLPFADHLRTLVSGRPRPSETVPGALRPVVYPPTWLRWDEMKQRPQFILEAFAKAGHDVFFVDTSEPAVRRTEHVTIVPSLRHVPGSSPILYVHFAPIRHVFDRFEDPVIVYDVLDDLSIYDDEEDGLPEGRRVRAHHAFVMARADVAMVSNGVLFERHRAERADLVRVENGVDVAAFSAETSRPDDLPPGAVVGYHGMISTWFDFDLLDGVAAARPDWTLVLVGPVDDRVRSRLEQSIAAANVVWLGERPSREMPAYASAFDVGVIWFRIDPMTEGVTPLKMFEYLAAGTPCVSTPLPAAVATDGVTTAATASELVVAIDQAMSEDPARIRRIGSGHDWTTRLEPVLERLDAAGRRRY